MDARKVKRVVRGLDPLNPNHWNAGDLPSIDAVRRRGSDPNIGREEITSAVGSFNRAGALAEKSNQTVDWRVVGDAAAEEGRTQIGIDVQNRAVQLP